MLKLTENGYTFVSKNGIEYDILEGMTIGESRKTSDIMFIMHDHFDDQPPVLVNWMYGATGLTGDMEEYEKVIAVLVDKYEREIGLEE